MSEKKIDLLQVMVQTVKIIGSNRVLFQMLNNSFNALTLNWYWSSPLTPRRSKYFFKILFQVMQQSRNPLLLPPQCFNWARSWQDNSQWMEFTLDLFLSDLHFGFCPIWEVKRTAWELSGISIRVWCDFEKFPLVNFILAASNRQMNKKKGEESDH